MLRKIKFFLLCALAFFSSSYASTTHYLQSSMSFEYELPSNVPQLFVNYMFWTVEANCIILSKDEKEVSVDLYVEALAKKGKINGTILEAGKPTSSIVITALLGNSLKLSAESGAKVRITNLGSNVIHAICST